MRTAHALVLCCALGACTDEIEIDSSTTTQAITHSNGENLNGENLNGTGLGNAIAWASFKNVKIGGHRLDRMWLVGSQIIGFDKHGHFGTTYAGRQLIGAEFKARTDTKAKLELRIADVVKPAPGSDVWRYALEAKIGGEWIPMCLADPHTGEGLNGPNLNGAEINQAIADGDVVSLPAIPVDGYWDYRQGVARGGNHYASKSRFTFACPVIGAIGKCVDAGYEPWNGLEDEHQTCVRTMRADFCGDGQPHTVSGTVINIYDDAGIQDDTESWRIEAEWDQDGATCVTDHLRHAVPVACQSALYDPGCGNPPAWDDGTLLVSEIN